MSIARNLVSNGNFIKAPGEYPVTIVEVEYGRSKKGQSMATLTFETFNQEVIKGYYVPELDSHKKALDTVKEFAGVSGTVDQLKGKKVGILVEQDPNNEAYMRIVGVGKAEDVTLDFAPASSTDGVPF
jgi:hypothetical protein